ncbi:MAG: DDE-type integrase/transposase/recombinase [Hyphomicrobiales bacterium]|nr:DDE-type integrase/transposase/recombinase [Hyphomicrobiales bacterium]
MEPCRPYGGRSSSTLASRRGPRDNQPVEAPPQGAVDNKGDGPESVVTTSRDKAAALKFLRKALRRNGRTEAIVTNQLASYGAERKVLDAIGKAEPVRWLKNQAEKSRAIDADAVRRLLLKAQLG